MIWTCLAENNGLRRFDDVIPASLDVIPVSLDVMPASLDVILASLDVILANKTTGVRVVADNVDDLGCGGHRRAVLPRLVSLGRIPPQGGSALERRAVVPQELPLHRPVLSPDPHPLAQDSRV